MVGFFEHNQNMSIFISVDSTSMKQSVIHLDKGSLWVHLFKVFDMKYAIDDKTDNLDKASICSTGSRGYRIKRWLGVRRSTWLLSMYIGKRILIL